MGDHSAEYLNLPQNRRGGRGVRHVNKEPLAAPPKLPSPRRTTEQECDQTYTNEVFLQNGSSHPPKSLHKQSGVPVAVENTYSDMGEDTQPVAVAGTSKQKKETQQTDISSAGVAKPPHLRYGFEAVKKPPVSKFEFANEKFESASKSVRLWWILYLLLVIVFLVAILLMYNAVNNDIKETKETASLQKLPNSQTEFIKRIDNITNLLAKYKNANKLLREKYAKELGRLNQRIDAALDNTKNETNKKVLDLRSSVIRQHNEYNTNLEHLKATANELNQTVRQLVNGSADHTKHLARLDNANEQLNESIGNLQTAVHGALSLQTKLPVVKGGWIVFQNRTATACSSCSSCSYPESMSRNWASYKNGFGSYHGDFWGGLEEVSMLTSKASWILRLEFIENCNTLNTAARSFSFEYDNFTLGDESERYQFHVGRKIRSTIEGDLFFDRCEGDPINYRYINTNKLQFATADNELSIPPQSEPEHSCRPTNSSGWATRYETGWWFCGSSAPASCLNTGQTNASPTLFICEPGLGAISSYLRHTRMMIQPAFFQP